MMRLIAVAVLLAGSLVSALANTHPEGRGGGFFVNATRTSQAQRKQPDNPAVFVIARRSSPGACAALTRDERDARRRGDWWRADQLQDAYRDCVKRGG